MDPGVAPPTIARALLSVNSTNKSQGICTQAAAYRYQILHIQGHGAQASYMRLARSPSATRAWEKYLHAIVLMQA